MGLVRDKAAKWHIDPHEIGVLGFSAGGYLVAEISTGTGIASMCRAAKSSGSSGRWLPQQGGTAVRSLAHRIEFLALAVIAAPLFEELAPMLAHAVYNAVVVGYPLFYR